MNCHNCGAEQDLSLISDEEFKSERGRRNVALRNVPQTGWPLIWNKHHPRMKACRCAKCTARRLKAAKTND
jgi:hypothetical protein